MITMADYYMGRDVSHAEELSDAHKWSAEQTVARANALLEAFGEDRGVRSGWRPAAINAQTPRAAKNSRHVLCQAIDINDNDQRLAKWCMDNLPTLELLGLWMENPESTESWVHVQIVAPGSGNRVFNP